MSRTEPEILTKESEIFQLGTFRLDIEKQLLQDVNGDRVALRSQSLQVLIELVKHRGEVVSKDTLSETIWQDTFVTDDSLVQCIADIRRAIGDSDHVIVQTVPKKGYHAIAQPVDPVNVPVSDGALLSKPRTGRSGLLGLAAAIVVLLTLASGYILFKLTVDNPPVAAQSVPLPTGPRIAIIPFRNLGEDPDDAFFSEGLTRSINAQLSRFSNLFVIAPQAGASFRDSPDCKTIRQELQADYILNGTVQRYNDRVRITTSFVDAKTCRQLTSPGPFDRDLNATVIFDIQLEISSKVASEVGSSDAPLFNVEVQRQLRDKAPESLEAYECVLLSYWFYQTFGPEDYRRARSCLERIAKEDPGYSVGWSRLAFAYLESKKRGYDTPDNWAQMAREAANTALQKDRNNPDAYYALAILSRMEGDDKSVFFQSAQKAIDLNPNDSWILADLGIFLAYSGEWEKGKEWITRARALNPKLHTGYTYAWILHAFLEGNYAESRDLQLSIGTGAKHPMAHASLTATYALNDEQEKAEEGADFLRQKFPDFAKDPRAPFRARGMPKELIDKLMEGLERAGYDVPPE